MDFKIKLENEYWIYKNYFMYKIFYISMHCDQIYILNDNKIFFNLHFYNYKLINF